MKLLHYFLLSLLLALVAAFWQARPMIQVSGLEDLVGSVSSLEPSKTLSAMLPIPAQAPHKHQPAALDLP